MLGLSAAFSTLSVDDSKLKNTKTKTVKTSHSSLPNISSTSGAVFIPPSSPVLPYSRVFDEDEPDTNDQPIDFSQKYSETSNNPYSVVKSYNSFNVYAETDLDQPTDYSLRYAEDDIDTEEKNIAKNEAPEFVQDTIKTYCTEDTPYETPFNFSNATSMSDLRIGKNEETPAVETKPAHTLTKSEFSSGLMSPEKPVFYCEEGTPGLFSRVGSFGSLNSILVDTKLKKEENKVKQLPSETKNVKFEAVVNYAEETPLMFSRSSSLASLDSIEQHSIHDDRSSVVSDFSRITSGLISPSDLPDSPTQTVPPSPRSRKKASLFTNKIKVDNQPNPLNSVFEDNLKNFKTESTPIQFSTATSLSNLSIDDFDKTDDVKKEDEKVETSENEDDEKKKEELETSVLFEEDDEADDAELLAQCINDGIQKNRFIQPVKVKEEVTVKEENTEIKVEEEEEDDKLILATCIEIGMKYNRYTQTEEENKFEENDKEENGLIGRLSEDEDDKVILATCIQMGMKCTMSTKNIEKEEAEKENDRDILATCIKMGMKYNRYTKEKSDKTTESPYKLKKNIKKEKEKTLVDILSEDENEDDQAILAACIKMGMKYNRYTQSKIDFEHKNDCSQENVKKPQQNPPTNGDSLRTYCTEDTPAILSNAGSHSDLSILSMNENKRTRDFLSDIENISDEENDKFLLNQCIQAAMPKSKPPSPPKTISQPPKTDNLDSSFSSNSDEDVETILKECILAGMMKNQQQKYKNKLSESDKILLQQCLLKGLSKSNQTNMKVVTDVKSLPSTSNCLSKAEKVLLQQCILSGMPKSKTVGKKRLKERPESGCCIHCPRNKHRMTQRLKKKSKTNKYGDVNILYMASQILVLKKEMLKKEEWV